MAQETDALEPDRLRFQLEDFKRKLDAQARELKAKDETGRRLEQRFRELNGQIRDLEERAGTFHREAANGTAELEQAEETLKVCDLARGQLSSALERLTQELARWKEECRTRKARIEELELSLRRREDALVELQKRYEEACRLLAAQAQAQPELDRQRKEFESERGRILEQARRELEVAEAVRREGVEALEEARGLHPRPNP